MAGDVHYVPAPSPAPKLPPYHLPRPRLVANILGSLTEKPLLLIQAPAGYGKTVLLAECLDYIPSKTTYLRFRPSYHDPAAQLQVYLHRLAEAYPGVAERVSQVLAQTGSPHAAFYELVTALAEVDDERVVIFDDFPADTQGPVAEYLLMFLDHLPPAWHVIICSRQQPNLPLGRWLAEDRITVFSETALAFDPSEAEQFVGTVLGYTLEPTTARLLHQKYDGWVLGLKLVATSFQQEPLSQLVQFLEQEHGLVWAIEEYLEREVILSEVTDPAEQDFVYRTAVLPELAIDICNDFLGISNAGDILRSLARRGLFVRRLDTSGTVYEYQPTFCHFLQARLRRRLGVSALATLHVEVAEVYAKREMWMRAITHYLAGGAYEVAASLLEAQGYSILRWTTTQKGASYLRARISLDPVQTVLDWFKQLPAALVEGRPRLLLLKANALRGRGAYAEARQLLTRASDLIRNQRDALDEARAAAEWAFVAFKDGRYHEAVDLLQQALPATDIEPAVRAETLLGLSINLNAMGDMRGALQAGESALAVVERILPREVRLHLEMRIARHLVYLYRDAGDLATALTMAERAYFISGDEHVGGAEAHHQSLRSRLLVYIALGDFDTARQVSDEWQAFIDKLGDKREHQAQLAVLRSRIALVEQDYEQAELWLGSVGSPGADLIQLRVLQGLLNDAYDLASLDDTSRVAKTAITPLMRSINQSWLGIIESHRGNFARGSELLEEALAFFQQRELLFWQAGVQLHVAWLQLRLGRPAVAQQYIAEAFDYSVRNRAFNFAFWHPDVVAQACSVALTQGIQADYAQSLAQRRLKAPQTRYFQPLTYQAQNGSREQAKQLVEVLSPPLTPDQKGATALNPAIEALIQQGHLTVSGANKLARVYQLAPREIEVFACYVDPNIRNEQRRVNDAIAERLFLSQATVRGYISMILRKLNAQGRDRLQLRAWAVAEGIIPA